MLIEIDPNAGFCFGVKNAIQKAEKSLSETDKLDCLGEIVHNEEEIERLNSLGLNTIEHDAYNKLKNKKILIRAHGEPPATYINARENNIDLIDATCPIVLKLQQKVKKAWAEMKKVEGSIVIAGKKNHPEIISLNGQTDNQAIILENLDDLDKVNIQKPFHIFAQTTLDKDKYEEFISELKSRLKNNNIDIKILRINNSICGHVSNRIPELKEFCIKYDVILFVSGKNSSNGKALFQQCKNVNNYSFHINSHKELNMDWFEKAKSVGISGATSTPLWLMEKIKQTIRKKL